MLTNTTPNEPNIFSLLVLLSEQVLSESMLHPPVCITTEPKLHEQVSRLNKSHCYSRLGLMEDVTNLTGKGIQNLVSGKNLQESLSLFGESIAILEQVLMSEACRDAMTDDDANSVDSIDTMSYSSISTAAHLRQEGIPNLSGGLLFVYHKAIEISAFDDPSYCRAAVLFNVSLTYHSLHQQTGQTLLLQNAVLFYDLSFQAFHNVSINVSMNCCCTRLANDFRIPLFMLAAWNNQSQIRLQMGDGPRIRDELQEQKALALNLLNRQQNLRQKEMEPILSEFIINEYIVRTSITAPIA